MMELLWLLLPLAAGSGWWAAKRSAGRAQTTRHGQPPDYFKGINYVLNEQPDKAIELFLQMLEVDSETVETHLALGNLYRRRGEVDRAIRIHQNLIAKTTLDANQRALALLELGQDYLRAGLFDRAENLFNELLEQKHYQEPALQSLLQIYEQEKEWARCLEIAARIEKLTGEALGQERAHYQCELAEDAVAAQQPAQAEEYLEAARKSDPDNVRATLLQARMEIERGAPEKAVQTLRRIESQDPAFLPEAFPLLEECYRRLGDEPRQVDYLKQLFHRHGGLAEMLALAAQIRSQQDPSTALDFVSDYLLAHPSLAGLERLIALEMESLGGADLARLQPIHQQVAALLKEQPAYQCKRCGFAARVLHWQCPGCKSWSSIRPIHSPNCHKNALP